MATVASTQSSVKRSNTRPVPTKARIAAAEAAVEVKQEPLKSSETIWVNALMDAGGFHRDALQLELAVGLAVFAAKADASKVDLQAKRALREVYEKAGYACKTPVGEDYKTVARRVSVAADLYQFLGGREVIVEWVEGVPTKQQVNKIAEHLKEYNFTGINSVLAYIGKPVQIKRTRDEEGQSEPIKADLKAGMPTLSASDTDRLVADAVQAHIDARKLAEAQGIPPGRIFQKGEMVVAIPFEAKYDDVVALAMELMTFAKTQMQLPVFPTH